MLLWSLRSSRGKSLGSSQEFSKHKSFLGYTQGFLGPSLYVGAFQSPYSSEYLIFQLSSQVSGMSIVCPNCYFLPQVIATWFTCLSMFLMNILNAATSPPREFEVGKTKASPLHLSFREPHRYVKTGKHTSLGTGFTLFLDTTLGMRTAVFNYCHSKEGIWKGYVKLPQSSPIMFQWPFFWLGFCLVAVNIWLFSRVLIRLLLEIFAKFFQCFGGGMDPQNFLLYHFL